jgi:predicted transcriptional regulator
MSKHEDIIKHILSLEVGAKISVRSIANDLGVSDGTAYRAIKDCDSMGIVTTIPRVGTVRVEKVEKKSIESLTYGEIVNIIDGTLFGGKAGVHKVLNKFIIGAMTLEMIPKYLSPNCLVLVGNREEVQRLALMNDCAVLITGGFSCSDEVKKLANEKALPIISSTYDTFTTATMINKAMSENLIKKDIILAEDIMITEPVYLRDLDKVTRWKALMFETKHERYPVVDSDMKVVGIVTLKDMPINDINDDENITKYMTKNIITVTPKTTAAYAAHIMAWEGIDMCPVVDGRRLIGLVSRHDVIKALQYISRQPQVGETIEDLVLKNFEFDDNGSGMHFSGRIIPEMLDPVGTASWSSLNMLLSTMGIMTLRERNNINITVDSISTYFMKPVQIDSHIEIITELIDMGRSFCKVEVSMTDNKGELIAKALMSAKVMKK